MTNHSKTHFAGAIDTLKTEFLRLQDRHPNLTEEEQRRQDEVARAIALLSGELPVYAHLFSFGADLNVSLFPTEELAIGDVKSVWTENKFDPEEDGSIVLSVRLNGEAGEGMWSLSDDGGLISSRGDDLIGFSAATDEEEKRIASLHDSLGHASKGEKSIDWDRYELTAQVVATQELTIDDECTQIDWNSIEDVISTTLIFVRNVARDLVFVVDVEGMEDGGIITAVVAAIHEHEQEFAMESGSPYSDLIIGAKYAFNYLSSNFEGVLLEAKDEFLSFVDVHNADDFSPALDIRAEFSYFSELSYADLD